MYYKTSYIYYKIQGHVSKHRTCIYKIQGHVSNHHTCIIRFKVMYQNIIHVLKDSRSFLEEIGHNHHNMSYAFQRFFDSQAQSSASKIPSYLFIYVFYL